MLAVCVCVTTMYQMGGCVRGNCSKSPMRVACAYACVFSMMCVLRRVSRCVFVWVKINRRGAVWRVRRRMTSRQGVSTTLRCDTTRRMRFELLTFPIMFASDEHFDDDDDEDAEDVVAYHAPSLFTTWRRRRDVSLWRIYTHFASSSTHKQVSSMMRWGDGKLGMRKVTRGESMKTNSAKRKQIDEYYQQRSGNDAVVIIIIIDAARDATHVPAAAAVARLA